MKKGALSLSIESVVVISFALLVIILILIFIGGFFLDNINFLNQTAFT